MAVPSGMVALTGFLDLDVYKGAFQDPTNGFVVLEPFASYYAANGGLEEFGHPKGGLYGRLGSIEQDFEYAHFQADGSKVVAQVKDRTNINNYSVGLGVLAIAKANKLEITSNEVYYTPNTTKLGQRSVTTAKDRSGAAYEIEAVQVLDEAGKVTGPWNTAVYKQVASAG